MLKANLRRSQQLLTLMFLLLVFMTLGACLQGRRPALNREALAAQSSPTPSPSSINWAPSPTCVNQPQDLAAWQLWLEDQAVDIQGLYRLRDYLWRGQAYTGSLQEVSPVELLAYLNTLDNTANAEAVRELTILWLNILSGRLNRASTLEAEAHPELQTVADVAEALEKALAEGQIPEELLEVSQQLQTGEIISRHTCARLLYRMGSTVRESTWTNDGYVEQTQIITDVPPGITSFSPNFNWLAVETAWNDAGGGPIYLFNLKSKQLVNLNQKLVLHDYGGPLGLSISGWHPQGDHLLLTDKDDGVVIWTDVQGEKPQEIMLNTGLSTPVREIELAPDGESFIYIMDDPQGKTMVNQYNLTTQLTTTLATLPIDRGRLASFQFSPVGNTAAYVQLKGKRTTGRTYALEIFNLSSYTVTTLIEGNLGPTEPIWSPDGQKIAFVRKSLDEPDVSGAGLAQPWQGNIWVVLLDTGEIRQVTFVAGAAQRPVWSPDNQHLAFITGDGELGLVDVEQPGVIWRLGATVVRPEFTAIAFVP